MKYLVQHKSEESKPEHNLPPPQENNASSCHLNDLQLP